MNLEPRSWRLREGLTVAEMARRAGISGKNPVRTYGRYETGEQPCPPEVIERVREITGGEVGAEGWQKARVEFLSARAA